jgi:hypothetical protein
MSISDIRGIVELWRKDPQEISVGGELWVHQSLLQIILGRSERCLLLQKQNRALGRYRMKLLDTRKTSAYVVVHSAISKDEA